MTEVEFKIYRDQRIRDLGRAYEDSQERSSDDPAEREAWERLRANWQDHAERVKAYAYEADTTQLMEAWRSVIRESRFRNEHEGIALNPNLTADQVAEIALAASGNENMYWVLHHLDQHPSKQ